MNPAYSEKFVYASSIRQRNTPGRETFLLWRRGTAVSAIQTDANYTTMWFP